MKDYAAAMQAARDLQAWVDTLDMSECLGHLEHAIRSSTQVTGRLEREHADPVVMAAVEGMVAGMLGMLGERIIKLHADTPVLHVRHGDELHTCTFLARMLAASGL